MTSSGPSATAHEATGIGSMPGEDFDETLRVVFGEVGGFPFLPELPARGVGATMVGRAVGAIGALAFDLQPAGWRLTDAPGVDHRRARALLGHDLDRLEETAQRHRGRLKLQLTGPWTMAATVERPRGDKVLADHGARRDLAQALAEAAGELVADVRRRLPTAELVLQIDEPGLPAVLAAQVPTASGFGRHRSVTPADAAGSLSWVLAAAATAGATPVLHCCAADLPLAVLRQTPVRALLFDLALLPSAAYDDLAAWVDEGRELWPGAVPTTEPASPPTDAALTRQVLAWWSALGYSEPEHVPATTVTPACGLAGASPSWAREALGLTRLVAANLSAEDGRMDG
jgi:methionine synthase II (cobalamin-independent)